jgi:GAF domain-containing protein
MWHAEGIGRRTGEATVVESKVVSAGEAVSMLADFAIGMADAPTLEDALQRALELAIDIVPGCQQAGISLQRGKRVETPASVGPLAAACITALRNADVVRIDDVLTDERWPDFAEGAAQLGLRSMFACRLTTTRDVLGALNLYSTSAGAFDSGSEQLALGYATHVGLALSGIDKERNLRKAMDSREVIGQAMGILMERHRITASQAFDLMVHVSQRSNVKLRAIAEELVQTGNLPSS